MNKKPVQLPLAFPDLGTSPVGNSQRRGVENKLALQDRAFHDWYRFVLSYPPHLVRDYIRDFKLDGSHTILDPFCGTGTTLVESQLNDVQATGVEANPFAHFASSVKTDWSVLPEMLVEQSRVAASQTLQALRNQGIDDEHLNSSEAAASELRTLTDEENKLILSDSISPLPLHKTLTLLDSLREREGEPYYRHQLLALANAVVFTISNLHFGPEVGIGKPKKDAAVVAAWLNEIHKMAGDLREVSGKPFKTATVHLADSRQLDTVLEPRSIDAVITSPPYPNEKDYTRTTRLESVILGFISNKDGLRQLKQTLMRSNTRNVYKGDDDDAWIAEHPEILRIADEIENRRIELGKTSGFEKMYSRVTKLYFGGMARHLAAMRVTLRPGAQLAYVVGDQASYLRVMIRTGQLIAEIAQVLGYELMRIDLFRTRFASATKEQLREEVVVLRWPG
jgi:DNA modification methylase